MVGVNWLRSLSAFRGQLSRRQRRVLASRSRRRGTVPVPCVQRLEDRTLLAAPNPLDLGSLDGTSGFRLDGVAASDQSGLSVSSAGDVNGDGFDDLIVGAFAADPNGNSGAGSSYVVFGRAGGFASVINLSTLDGTNGFRLDGVAAGDQSGVSVSSAGDVNGDGFDDLIVGAVVADPNGNLNAGSSYVVFGRGSGFAAVINLSTLNGTTGFRLDGVAASDLSGRSVSSAGDVNGDGFDDLIVGAYAADPNGNSQAGSSYVVFGRAGGFASVINLSTLDGTNGFRLDGVAASDQSGRSVSSAGDVNGDGFDDLIVGAFAADPNGNLNAGSSYVVFGRAGGFAAAINLSTLNGTTGFRLDGVAAGDQSGFSVSSAGDVNGDGFDDLIVGAFVADPNGNSFAGSSYVVFGGNFTGGAQTQVGGDGADTLTAAQGAAAVDVLIGGRGADLLISDGGPDVLRGGEGDDVLAIVDADFSGTRRIVGGSGIDTLRLDGAGLTLNLTAIPDNRITGIEAIDLSGLGTAALTLDVQDVLNISDSSNTLSVFANGDTINIGSGWTQQANLIVSGVVYEVFTQGAATLRITHSQIVTLPAGNGADNVTIRRNGEVIEVFDNLASAVLKNVPVAFASSIVVNAAAGEDNRVLVDFDFGGFFELPFGIHFFGGSGGTDSLDVLGNGLTQAALTSTAGGLDAGLLTLQQGVSQTVLAYSGIEPLTATGLLTFAFSNPVDLAGQTLTIGSAAFVEADSVIILGGGTLDLSGGGILFDNAALLIGSGLVDGRITQRSGSVFSATGSLTLGDAASFAGFFTDGELNVNTHTVTLLDANEAVLGSLTLLGSGGMSGTLAAANGFLLEEGKNLTGQGSVGGAFHNDGHVSGGGTGIVFNDLVTGIGRASNVTYNGGFSPGHSPAEVFLGGTVNLGDTNTLFIELGGRAPGSGFDRLSSTGTVNLDGALDVSFINAFTPANGDSFEIIGASALGGTFDATNLPALPLGLEWDVVYSADALTLNVFALSTAVTATALNSPLPNSNRSGIGSLSFTFDLPVNVQSAGSLTLFNHTSGTQVDVSAASLVNDGTPSVSWDFSSLSLPDGRYTAELATDQVTTTVGGPLARTHTIAFHVLQGDANGSGSVNAADFSEVTTNFSTSGTAYRTGDTNGDGFVNAGDFSPITTNFSNSLAALMLDFGDAPQSGTSFPTTLAQDGARHVITGNTLRLGATRDAESDGQPSADASGDGADDDGLTFGSLVTGTTVSVTIQSSGPGFINGWVDFNRDGDWDDAGEQVLADAALEGGTNDLQIEVPPGAEVGTSFARFRLTGTAGYSYRGLAPNGEVEDYLLTITAPTPESTASIAAAGADSTPGLPSLWWTIPQRSEGLFMSPGRPFALIAHPFSLFSPGLRSRFNGR